MKNPIQTSLFAIALGAACLTPAASASTVNLPVQNAGFDTATGNLADSWNSNGGSVRGGNEGGFGWTASYFGGTFPTNNTFATTFGGPIRQDLTGPGSTFVAGATYTLKADLFGSTNYKAGDSRMWTLALTGDGVVVAQDQWFSDEFASQKVSNGGAIPDNHIITVNASSTGLTTATLTFTVPAELAGQVIGIRLGGDASAVYTLASGSPATDDYFGFMDNISLVVSEELIAAVDSFYADDTFIGDPITLSWRVVNPSVMNSLTLDSGSGEVSVLAATNPTTGEGSIAVNPSATTTYTLKANGSSSKQVTISGGEISSFSTTSKLGTAANNHQVTLNWQVYPPGLPIKISDGTTDYNVAADTDESGSGTHTFSLTNTDTTFTLNQNNGSDTATVRVLREAGNSAAFSLNKAQLTVGEAVTASWAGTGGDPNSWIGIYNTAQVPNTNQSLQWNYLSGSHTVSGSHPSGSMNFTLPVGNYYAVLFLDEEYTIEQGPIAFSVVEVPPVEPTIKVGSITRTGNSVTVVWESKAGQQYDIYASETMAGAPKTTWEHVGTGLPSNGDGTTSFTETLPAPAPMRRFYKIYESATGQ
ncbi:hypothetical protein [Haloferula sp. BvORR071]|uniref:hypothetical protein n=1 Tax=Haloferula sp. BvORR071 TaxID=1396141 RepID=UPI00054ECD89|nr:hypothetical protein [Haloferula sp. BvORR071]